MTFPAFAFLQRLAILVLFCFATGAADTTKPKVYCFAMGVSDNPDKPLLQAKGAADAFVDSISRLFSTNSEIHSYTSTNNPADRDAVEHILYDVIPSIPKYSSIIFYFAGHGLRSQTNTYDEDLHLLLAGAKTTEYRRKSLRFSQLADALGRTKMVTGLVVLDCCFSGSGNDQNLYSGKILRINEKTCPRFVYYFASGKDQNALSGKFTHSFLKNWESLSTNKCVSPNLLFQKLVATANADSEDRGFRSPEQFPPDVAWCYSNFGRPSSILVIVPFDSYRPPALTIDGVDVTFSNKDEPYYLGLVPKDQNLTIVSQDGFHSVSTQLTTNELADDIVVLELSRDSMMLLGPESTLGLNASQIEALSNRILAGSGDSRKSAAYLELAGRSLTRLNERAQARNYLERARDVSSPERSAALLALLNNPAPIRATSDGNPLKMELASGSGTVDPTPEASVKIAESTIYYAPNQVSLDSFDKRKLNHVAEFLKSDPDSIVRIESHTDSVGTEESNRTLAERRAMWTRNILVGELGVPSDRVKAIGKGEDKPVSVDPSAAGQAKNRRTEFYLDRK
jgi:outer membrane protein OmpA-like peptidoglycan-associated protein